MGERMQHLIFGENEQVARELGILLGSDATLLGRNRVDLSQPGQARTAIENAVKMGEVDAIINAAAYTASMPLRRTATRRLR
jgi:dTDP-4-dehydrorhamnose reductase